MPFHRNIIGNIFTSSATLFMKQLRFVKVFQAFPFCASGKSHVYMNMSMDHWKNYNDRDKTEVLGVKPVPVPLSPPQISYGLSCDRTRVSAMTGRRLTVYTMAWTFKEENSPELYLNTEFVPRRKHVFSLQSKTLNAA